MKQITCLFLSLCCLLACGENNAPKTGAEAAEQEIKPVEKTADTVKVVEEEVPAAANPNADQMSSSTAMAKITGSNVTMRKEGTVKSEKMGSFDQNEGVEVLETKNVNNEGEAILSKPVTVKGSGGEINLTKGKAVVIEKYASETNRYEVTYQDPQKGKLSAEVDASAVETITYSTWYKVKRKNGETGWVLGKFLKIN